MRPAVFFWLILLSTCVSAQEPRAVITGPKEAQLGDLIVLNGGESTGTSRLWLLAAAPSPKTFMPVNDGRECVFATGTPGDYTFVLVVAGIGVNGNALAQMATHTVKVLGGQAPVNPTPFPPATNPYPPPPAALQAALQPIFSIQLTTIDGRNLAELYAAAQKLVMSAPAAIAAGTKPEIATTADLRAWLVVNGQQHGLQGKYPGLADAVDRYFGTQLGTELRQVTPQDGNVLLALAWAVWRP